MALNHALKSILVAGLVLSTSAAFASKARMAALQNAEHIDDAQTVFQNPALANRLGSYATLEFGATSTNTTATTENGAEGGFLLKKNDMSYGLYLGRKSKFTTDLRRTLGFIGQENPVEITVAGRAGVDWGAAFNYSQSEQTAGGAKGKQSAMGLRLGAMTDLWSAGLVLGLGSEAENNNAATVTVPGVGSVATAVADPDSKYKGTTGVALYTRYFMGSTTAHFSYLQDGAELTSPLNTGTNAWNDSKVETNQFRLGVIETVKADAGSFFYGASYQQTTSKRSKAFNTTPALAAALGEQNTVVSTLPLIVGFEMNATEMITLRGSVTQNFLIGENNSKVTGGEKTTVANNTVVAGGVGLKYKNFMIDGVLEAGNTGVTSTTDESGDLNVSDSFVTRAGLTYNF